MLEALNIYLIVFAAIALTASFILDRIMCSYRDMAYFRILLPSTMHFIHFGGKPVEYTIYYLRNSHAEM
jgi:hypothetical protein